jgi:tetratricopeptide (TPR) repeat protein
LSHDLLEVIGRASANIPILVLVVYRPPELHHLQAPRVSELAHFTEIELVEFTSQEADQLIQMKLAQFFGSEARVSPDLFERITTQAAGNPFYIEELLNYLKTLGVDPMDQEALAALDLPGSITRLILSRIDQLAENEQITIKVASVIGRLFSAAMVWGIYPKLGDKHKIQENLETVQKLELTVMDVPEPELTYIFKHVFTQEVAYDSLPYATQAMLHEAIGEYIEGKYADTLDQYTNILAHHYEHSENEAKKCHYLRKAGESAQRDYANIAAIDYYQKVLPLLADYEQVKVRLNLGKVLELIGDWEPAGETYMQALDLAKKLGDIEGQAWVETAIAEFFRKQGRFDEASDKLLEAKSLFGQIDDLAGIGQVLHYQGTIADQQGDYELARRLMEESFDIRQQIGDKRQSAYLLGNMGIVARRQGDLEKARDLYEQSLTLRRQINDRWGVANVLNNLGNLLLDLDEWDQARAYLEEAVAIHQELGDRWAIGNALNNLANVLRTQNDYPAAKDLYNKSLVIYRDLGDKWALAYLFEDVAWLAALQQDGGCALRLRTAAAVLREQINAPLTSREAKVLDEALAPALACLDTEEYRLTEADGKSISLEDAIIYALDAPSL